ncbi:hypothetical protein DSM21852_41200 [Methylocystis bryophila]|nr:hypothetical protein DSM21852_41200 [Methylocystis bryophila]
MRRGERSRRLGAVGAPKKLDAVVKGHRGLQRRALQGGERALAGELTDRTGGNVAALAGRVLLTACAVCNGAYAILENCPLAGDGRGMAGGRGRQ